jgi:hypothetical protein
MCTTNELSRSLFPLYEHTSFHGSQYSRIATRALRFFSAIIYHTHLGMHFQFPFSDSVLLVGWARVGRSSNLRMIPLRSVAARIFSFSVYIFLARAPYFSDLVWMTDAPSCVEFPNDTIALA